MIKAVIFDMDGVIVDTEPIYYERLHEFFKVNEVHPDLEELDKIAGASSTDTWDTIQRIWGKTLNKHEYDQAYEEYFKDRPVNNNDILDPNLKTLLDWLVENQYKIALASSSSMAEIQKVLEECNLSHYFESILSGDMFRQSKPNPEIYLKSAVQLDVEPAECLVIEDSTHGITAAKAAGMYVLAKRDERFNFNQNLSDKIIDRLTDAITELKELKK
ncbi:haloacid dehalogenase superfamily, subfamily IA, variant 3 with third motif having DD or ED/haloacid dehalogenase superfamily, subfamily IA, variant 1 with third motif having Dx(3-4)D or Dx(3-4)E [Carnobacterium iners]|uniref:Haloacid dehalogenase superfamily, subfamily IA, variant 3 with third motif having DD or ED/haloacid dehalogenase superfamily, subfamily IA, variant 1 with third motif having Dx(3-4)D or Dx(3-4)E n=1 Tax=Carnobacterium iners TaxID=1073423 RepID=A0A1X7MYX0_9LACT|nr:HAD family phosphatase [Carnobacterium iners]SEK19918.1 haloacid dehalogenase superfamily, subfamily IA, variant 3 with third motif having DD or ED/haloacid dehalogenase superfamily, subfamily IA, variant 1 with third motif having Dx(3-4)D or Dx(3-4)E [Carnobacterium iners]SMH30129.1 haloacid dehalogenase superfamily, subfamily IA, variant 3 with third motif having DD or ED/haloacid dehalogenase superfamily, subfamily IA, variant 1 with third motif having Dx(3-4)D or Dx(3-4)E [Carnobacterium i